MGARRVLVYSKQREERRMITVDTGSVLFSFDAARTPIDDWKHMLVEARKTKPHGPVKLFNNNGVETTLLYLSNGELTLEIVWNGGGNYGEPRTAIVIPSSITVNLLTEVIKELESDTDLDLPPDLEEAD
jgi:hypothetical protein